MPVWIVLSATSVVFFGGWSLLLKLALAKDNDFASVAVTSSIGVLGVALIAYLMFVVPGQLPTTVIAIALLLASGIALSVSLLFYSQALERGPVSVVVPMYALSPLLTVVLSVIFLKENLTLTQSAGLGLAVISIFLLSTKETSNE